MWFLSMLSRARLAVGFAWTESRIKPIISCSVKQQHHYLSDIVISNIWVNEDGFAPIFIIGSKIPPEIPA